MEGQLNGWTDEWMGENNLQEKESKVDGGGGAEMVHGCHATTIPSGWDGAMTGWHIRGFCMEASTFETGCINVVLGYAPP